MEFASGYSGNYFAAHYLAFHVGIGVYFSGVVAVRGDGFVGGELFKPHIEIMVQAAHRRLAKASLTFPQDCYIFWCYGMLH